MTANCKVVGCGQDVDAMGKGALATDILLEGSLSEGR